MSPRLAVAENLAQLEALFNQSRFSLRNTSLVVPKCISPLAMTVALWVTEFLTPSCAGGGGRTLHAWDSDASKPFYKVLYSGKFLKEENFRKFQGFVTTRKSFLREMWCLLAAPASNPRSFLRQKSYFPPIHERFLPQKFPIIRYSVSTCTLHTLHI